MQDIEEKSMMHVAEKLLASWFLILIVMLIAVALVIARVFQVTINGAIDSILICVFYILLGINFYYIFRVFFDYKLFQALNNEKLNFESLDKALLKLTLIKANKQQRDVPDRVSGALKLLLTAWVTSFLLLMCSLIFLFIF